jgi:hypothetical protein
MEGRVLPNWVFNRVRVEADEETLSLVESAVSAPVSDEDSEADGDAVVGAAWVPLSFQKIVPCPDSVEDWYDWNIANWGTKWDAQRVEVEREPGVLRYVFDTAWSPPLPVVDAWARLFPQATVTLDFQEEQGWGGSVSLRGTEMLAQAAYDIPESHAEVAERGGVCNCDEEFQAFDDCWVALAQRTGVTDPETLDAVRALAPRWEGTFEQLLNAAARV